jgi:hypothetical protein
LQDAIVKGDLGQHVPSFDNNLLLRGEIYMDEK